MDCLHIHSQTTIVIEQQRKTMARLNFKIHVNDNINVLHECQSGREFHCIVTQAMEETDNALESPML